MLVLLATLLGACEQSSVRTTPQTTGSTCVFAPPAGPFEVRLEPGPAPPRSAILPDNDGASVTLITPDARHRWAPKVGLVETLDGSLLLRGVARGPTADPGALNVVVLVDYAPAPEARLTVHAEAREKELGELDGARMRWPNEAESVAFDISLPRQTVPIGRYREVQTVVWFDRASVDARRWTVYAGPHAPPAVECVAAVGELPEMPTRSNLGTDGAFVVRAPRATNLAVVPITSRGPGVAKFLRIDTPRHGWRGSLGEDVELVAAWEAPYAGPAPTWISNFWSARPHSNAAQNPDLR